MSGRISLRRNFALTLLGNVVYGAAQWGMLVTIAKLGSTVMVGRFALALAVTTPVIMFSSLSLRSVLATDAADRYEFVEYLGLSLSMMAGAWLVIAGLGIYIGGARDSELLLIVLIVGLAKAFEQISHLFFGLMQKHERMDLIARSLTFKGAVSLMLFAAAMFLTRSLLWGTAALAFAWAVTLFGWDMRNARGGLGTQAAGVSFRPRFEPSRLKSLAALALPLGFADLLYAVLANIPRYFVGTMLGERELGIFAAMAYVSIVGARVISALGASAVPRLAKFHQQGDVARYVRLVLMTAAVGVLIGAVGMALAVFWGKEILTLLYRPEYAERLDAFIWLMAAAGIGYVALFLEYGMTAARRFWPQPMIVSASAAVLVIGSVILVPSHGLTGMAIAMTASSAVQLCCRVWMIRRIVSDLERGAHP